jgi:Transcriptional regulator containing PAS, AAA-type ATPase, and DNA-binding domains
MAFLARKHSVGRDIANEAIAQGPESHSAEVDKTDSSTYSCPAPKSLGNTLHEKIANYRLHLIAEELQKSGGNKSQAAKNLGITPQHLAKVLKEKT